MRDVSKDDSMWANDLFDIGGKRDDDILDNKNLRTLVTGKNKYKVFIYFYKYKSPSAQFPYWKVCWHLGFWTSTEVSDTFPKQPKNWEWETRIWSSHPSCHLLECSLALFAKVDKFFFSLCFLTFSSRSWLYTWNWELECFSLENILLWNVLLLKMEKMAFLILDSRES